MTSSDPQAALAADQASEHGVAIPEVWGGRFKLSCIIHGGWPSLTALATDENDKQAVIRAIRRDRVAGPSQERIRSEIVRLQHASHPSLIAPLMSGHEGRWFFVATPLAEGLTLRSRLDQHGPLSVLDTIALGKGLLDALHRAHQMRVIHGDVNPGNIVVSGEFDVARPAVLGFGLRSIRSVEVPEDGSALSRAQYVSPEEAGALDREVGFAADLYSAGVVLYESLIGDPPYTGTTIGDVLRKHLLQPFRDTRRSRQDVPLALEECLRRLLKKDPQDRYQSADAVVEDLSEIGARLAAKAREPRIVIGRFDRRTTLADPCFVGRSDELQAFDSALETCRDGQDRLLLLEGMTGTGKTRFLDEVAVRAVQGGAFVLRGRGTDHPARRPLEILEGVAGDLVAAAKGDHGLRDTIRRYMRDRKDAACAALPLLSDLLGADKSETSSAEPSTVAALAALLEAIGIADKPAVVLLDDCQWSDELLPKVLAGWRESRSAEKRERRGRLLVVAAFRMEEIGADHPLRSLPADDRLSFKPLSAEDAKNMMLSMAGPCPEEALSVAVHLSEGNPVYVAGVLHSMVETGALKPTPSGWVVEQGALTALESTGGAGSAVPLTWRGWRGDAVLLRRLGLLASRTVRLLTVAATLGREFDREHALALSQLSDAEVDAALNEAHTRRILLREPNGDRWRFSHEKLHETLLGMVSPGELQRLHRTAAASIEASDPTRAAELAHHFDAAAELESARPHALVAAEAAFARFSFELAEKNYQIAAKTFEEADDAARWRIAIGFGKVLTRLSKFEEAQRYFERALAVAKDDRARAEVAASLGELFLQRSDAARAIVHLESALRTLGERVPKRGLWGAISVARELMVQVLHTLSPKAHPTTRRPAEEQKLFAVRVYTQLSVAQQQERDVLGALRSHLRAMNIAERFPPGPELGDAYAYHSTMLASSPLANRAIRYAEKAVALADVLGTARALAGKATALAMSGKVKDALEAAQLAASFASRSGDAGCCANADYLLAESYYRAGNVEPAIDLAQRLVTRAPEYSKLRASALEVWSRAAGGRVSPELISQQIERSKNDLQSLAVVLSAEAIRLLNVGRTGKAVLALERACRMSRGIRRKAEILPWLSEAVQRSADEASPFASSQRAALLRRAHRVGRRAWLLSLVAPLTRPAALRAIGLAAARRGRARAAARHLRQSLEQATQMGMRLERARTLVALGRVGLEHGWPGAAEQLAEGRTELIAIGAELDLRVEVHAAVGAEVEAGPAMILPAEERNPAPTLSLVDRFTTLLEAGRRIATSLERRSIFEGARAAMLLLFRCDECLIIEMDDGGGMSVSAGDASQGYDPELVKEAIRRGRAIGRSHRRALGSGDPRSLLCAPYRVRGRIGGCIAVMHRGVGGLFGAEGERIGEFVATLTGAALENGEHYAEVQALSKSLEARVAERTAQLADANHELSQSLVKVKAMQEQLVAAGKKAVVATLVAGLSHELNNPLGVISGSAQMLLSGAIERSSDRAQRSLEAVERQARRCTQLLRGLQDLTGRVLERESVSVEELIQRVEELSRDSAGQKGVRVETQCAANMGAIWVDRAEIESAVLNVVKNAIEATEPSGEVRLSAGPTARGDEPGVQICVADRGTGIAEAALSRIFDPFFTTKPVGEGIGLGLTLARQFVESHLGEIRVESEPGRGTLVKLWLPWASRTRSGAFQPAR